jgi:hypothetical protein
MHNFEPLTKHLTGTTPQVIYTIYQSSYILS